ncbi:DNA adenine methylase [Arthrobacter citreus]|uniref:DNA adenine methylase n=1 Tax=Arthrobacter citreus TaxID=1670 RepID=UPI0036D98542
MSAQPIRNEFPLPMQYLGSKQRITNWLLDEVSTAFPNTTTFVDLMSGSGVVANQASRRGYTIVANDMQRYSYRVLHSVFRDSRDGLSDLIAALDATTFTEDLLLGAGREAARDSFKLEREFLEEHKKGRVIWQDYRDFCEKYTSNASSATGNFDLFTSYYPNTYFGVRQCLEIDTLKQLSAQLPASLKSHLMASIISAMTFLASTTTHLAQFLKPSSHSSARNLLSKRSISVKEMVISRLNSLVSSSPHAGSTVLNLGYEDALNKLDLPGGETVVYADPPYFKEHYSRYYHVLDTMELYDYPPLTFNKRINSVTTGLYRDERTKSDFGLKSKAPAAFSRLFSICAQNEYRIAISYASTSLVSPATIASIAAEYGYTGSLRQKNLRHSGQGQVRTNAEVIEYLFLFHKESSLA